MEIIKMEPRNPQVTETQNDEKSSKIAQNGNENSKKLLKSAKKSQKSPKNSKNVIFTTIGILGILGGIGCAAAGLLLPKSDLAEITFPKIPSNTVNDGTYSKLTGLPLAAGEAQDAPAYCVQTPNGTDGARPQAGLTQAGVVFEAIAEAGITRFAAIYQNPTSAVIGPIRSLRIYYLEWDTPFDCTIVHAGGSGDALAAVAAGGYQDLSEDYNYMYRGTAGSRLWNNLFTTAADLKAFSADHGYNKSEINGFARMTPEESARDLVDKNVAEKLVITEPARGDTSEIAPQVTQMALNFGYLENYNVVYNYDAGSNTYARSYGTGVAHEVYECPDRDLGEVDPESACVLTQMAPSVVVAMVVSEGRAADGYHEDIQVTGTGEAYIFQNGYAVKGKWAKSSDAEQIKFFDSDGEEMKLAVGQTFISAIPSYGSVDY